MTTKSSITVDGNKVTGDLVSIAGIAEAIKDIVRAGHNRTIVLPGQDDDGNEVKHLFFVGPTTTYRAVLVDEPENKLREMVYTHLETNVQALLLEYEEARTPEPKD